MTRPGRRESSQAVPASLRKVHHRPLPADTSSTTTSATSAPMAHAACRRQRKRGGTEGGYWAGSVDMVNLERDTDAQVQSELAHLLAVGHVDAQRPHRAAPAQARAVAEGGAQVAPPVGRLAGVDERRPEELR